MSVLARRLPRCASRVALQGTSPTVASPSSNKLVRYAVCESGRLQIDLEERHVHTTTSSPTILLLPVEMYLLRVETLKHCLPAWGRNSFRDLNFLPDTGLRNACSSLRDQ